MDPPKTVQQYNGVEWPAMKITEDKDSQVAATNKEKEFGPLEIGPLNRRALTFFPFFFIVHLFFIRRVLIGAPSKGASHLCHW